MRLTELAHRSVAPALRDGDLAADATAGNGHDTLALARAVGETGRVWAFDIQREALDATRRRLERAGLAERVTLVHDTHARIRDHIPAEAHGRLAVVMANLGYLPGGDTAVITDPCATLAMLEAALALLRPGGVLSVIAYPGHRGGDIEAAATLDFVRSVAGSGGATLELHGDPQSPGRTPWLALLKKREKIASGSDRDIPSQHESGPSA